MSRRNVHPSDASRWVFNRMAGDYPRRPAYPAALVARLVALAGGPGARVADLGAGTGHLALPLAAAGLRVTAVEPARAMLDGLSDAAARAGLAVEAVHAAAEDTGLPARTFSLALLADAAQWVDPPRAGAELARLLAPGGRVAFVVPAFAPTPFMHALGERIAAANPKARPHPPPVEAIAAAAGLALEGREVLRDDVALSPDDLAAVLRAHSYVGPALGPAGLAALLADARALAEAHGGAAWARDLALAWTARAASG
ncbi:MAG: methyltransferase domain-containing protein [Anaeromyxobacteraceae bacterium]